MRTLGNILHAGVAAIRIRSLDKKLKGAGMASWLWPLIKGDFWESVCGRTAARNLLWVELFDAALAKLPRQRLGFYLWENQGWEQAMIHAWRKHGHGELIAVAHATIRFWDLRYFNDPRVFDESAEQAMPLPDKFAVNGPVARDFLIDSGYPVSRLSEVEAQRYLGLAELSSIKQVNKEKSNRRVLILGDIMPTSTQRLLRTLTDLPTDLRNNLDFVFKPHPGNDTIEEYPNVCLTLTRRPLAEILADFDIVYGANPTSAVVDAYVAGLPVIVQLDTGEINFSPLRGVPGVRFVSEADELASALAEIYPKDYSKREQFFWLETEMMRWRSVICALDHIKFHNESNTKEGVSNEEFS
jgi:surface carbohydrate biosynthesis protein (TIGR04326 family)